jgi:hypothetical protein
VGVTEYALQSNRIMAPAHDYDLDLQRLFSQRRRASLRLARLLRRIRERCRDFEEEIDRYQLGWTPPPGKWQVEN